MHEGGGFVCPVLPLFTWIFVFEGPILTTFIVLCWSPVVTLPPLLLPELELAPAPEVIDPLLVLLNG